jgi:hypothetical protein
MMVGSRTRSDRTECPDGLCAPMQVAGRPVVEADEVVVGSIDGMGITRVSLVRARLRWSCRRALWAI